MIKVVASVVPQSGIHLHRLVNPIAYMPVQDDIEFSILEYGKPVPECDILIFNKWMDITPAQIRTIQKAGTKVIVDIDDIWKVPRSHHNYQSITERGIDKMTEENMLLADVIFCTTERLREQVLPFNKNVEIIPNGLPFGYDQYTVGDRQRAREISGHNKTVFMYLAGSTHKDDVNLLRGKFKRIGGDSYLKKNAEFVLCGYTQHQTGVYATKEDWEAKNGNYTMKVTRGPYDDMAAVFRETNSFRIYPSVDLDNYLNYYDSADVAIAPLQDTFWNSCKSELKIIEAACKKVPIICSDVPPYSDIPTYEGMMMVNKNHDWVEHIRYCTKNPERVKEMGEILYDRVSQEYDLIKINQKRLQIIRSLI